jgi:hypothetical protein
MSCLCCGIGLTIIWGCQREHGHIVAINVGPSGTISDRNLPPYEETTEILSELYRFPRIPCSETTRQEDLRSPLLLR